MFLDCLANLILAISCHGIIFDTHMEALGMMVEEFSQPSPPQHQQLRRIWPSGSDLSLWPTLVHSSFMFWWCLFHQSLLQHCIWDPWRAFWHILKDWMAFSSSSQILKDWMAFSSSSQPQSAPICLHFNRSHLLVRLRYFAHEENGNEVYIWLDAAVIVCSG